MKEKIEKLLILTEQNPEDVKFADLCKICDYFFGEARQKATSHRIYKTPWIGDPRINIQKRKDGKSKAYQVRQVLAAINKLKDLSKNS